MAASCWGLLGILLCPSSASPHPPDMLLGEELYLPGSYDKLLCLPWQRLLGRDGARLTSALVVPPSYTTDTFSSRLLFFTCMEKSHSTSEIKTLGLYRESLSSSPYFSLKASEWELCPLDRKYLIEWYPCYKILWKDYHSNFNSTSLKVVKMLSCVHFWWNIVSVTKKNIHGKFSCWSKFLGFFNERLETKFFFSFEGGNCVILILLQNSFLFYLWFWPKTQYNNQWAY